MKSLAKYKLEYILQFLSIALFVWKGVSSFTSNDYWDFKLALLGILLVCMFFGYARYIREMYNL